MPSTCVRPNLFDLARLLMILSPLSTPEDGRKGTEKNSEKEKNISKERQVCPSLGLLFVVVPGRLLPRALGAIDRDHWRPRVCDCCL